MLTVATAHYLSTLADSKKGSLTNRHQAAKEHFKNDLVLGTTIGIPAVAAGVVAATGKAGVVATKSGSVLSKTYSYLSKALATLGKTKIGKFLKLDGAANCFKNIASEIGKNPKKYGAIGLAVFGGLYLINRTAKYCNKAGRIDQKYEDAAKIESQTKNVVLEEKIAKNSIKPVFVE